MTARRAAARLLLQLASAPLVALRRRLAADDEPCARDCPTGCPDRDCPGTWC